MPSNQTRWPARTELLRPIRKWLLWLLCFLLVKDLLSQHERLVLLVTQRMFEDKGLLPMGCLVRKYNMFSNSIIQHIQLDQKKFWLLRGKTSRSRANSLALRHGKMVGEVGHCLNHHSMAHSVSHRPMAGW